MSKTIELRGELETILKTFSDALYYRYAFPNANFPYAVYNLQSINGADLLRFDYDLCIDLWDRSVDGVRIEHISDAMDAQLDRYEIVTDNIIATIFRENSYPVDEVDKQIQHIQKHYTVRLFVVRSSMI